MRGLLSKNYPGLERVLVVESGPREVADKLLTHLYHVQGSQNVDVLTCYGNPPATFDPDRGTTYSIHDPAIARRRNHFIRQVAGRGYSAVVLLCTGSPVMTRWKWAIALRANSRAIVVNENADYFYLDWQHRRVVQLLLSQRLGFGNSVRLGLLSGLILVPCSYFYLILFAAWTYLRRALRPKYRSVL